MIECRQAGRARGSSGNRARLLSALLCVLCPTSCLGLDWQVNEAHLQYGVLDVPRFAGGGDARHVIYSLQHASGWAYGDNFLFVDLLDARRQGFQDQDAYGEAYTSLSLAKLFDRPVGAGLVSDLGPLLGVNFAADAKVRKYLPGVRLSLNLPGFSFANLDVMAYLDDSRGAANGGAPKEENGWLVDFNFALPFVLAGAQFSFEGHLEYLAARDNEFSTRQPAWVLFQPQLRWRASEHLSLGVEYQFWRNKLGDRLTDEKAMQALVVWVF